MGHQINGLAIMELFMVNLNSWLVFLIIFIFYLLIVSVL